MEKRFVVTMINPQGQVVTTPWPVATRRPVDAWVASKQAENYTLVSVREIGRRTASDKKAWARAQEVFASQMARRVR